MCSYSLGKDKDLGNNPRTFHRLSPVGAVAALIHPEGTRAWAASSNSIGHKVIGITHSHITGNKGTREFFLRITLGSQNNDYTYDKFLIDVDNAIENVIKIDLFKKL